MLPWSFSTICNRVNRKLKEVMTIWNQSCLKLFRNSDTIFLAVDYNSQDIYSTEKSELNRWYSWDSSKLLAVFIENWKNKRCNAKIILTLFGPRKPYLYLSCITLMVFCFSYCSCVDPMLLIWILIYDETDATSYSQFLHTTDQPWAFLISTVLLSLLFSFLSLFCLSAFVCDGNRDSHVRRRSYHAIFSRFPPFATWSKFDSVRHYQQLFVFSSKPPEALSNTADVSFARDTLDFSQFWLKNYSITLFFRERQWDRT